MSGAIHIAWGHALSINLRQPIRHTHRPTQYRQRSLRPPTVSHTDNKSNQHTYRGVYKRGAGRDEPQNRTTEPRSVVKLPKTWELFTSGQVTETVERANIERGSCCTFWHLSFGGRMALVRSQRKRATGQSGLVFAGSTNKPFPPH